MNVSLIAEKGGKAWVGPRKEDCSYIQCLNCGEIYIMERKIPISVSIVKSECPRCQHDRGLHCGYNEMDVMELKNPYLDGRYFNYEK
jgi:hypothetical protein